MDDIIIIGAGIIGTSIGRELSKYQANIRILEKGNDVSLGATKANSAIVHGGFAEPFPSLKATLCVEGRKKFALLNEQLNFGYRENGSLLITFEDDSMALEQLLQKGTALGISGLKILNQQEIQIMEPNLSKDIRYALYCSESGICSPYEMAIAMAENAIANGVELELEAEVIRIDIKIGSEPYFIVHTKDQAYPCRYIVNAAGMHAGKIAEMINDTTIKIHPVSGEYILFARGTGKGLNHTIFQLPSKKGKGVLATATYYDNLLIGPDAEATSDVSTHEERLVSIYQQAKQFYPNIAPNLFIRSFAGLRAKEESGDFIIRESKVPNFIHVAGIQSPGLTASPAIAEMVVALLKKAGLMLNKNDDFNPHRRPIVSKKPLLPIKEVQPLLDLPLGSEGRMVCRCEQVLEAEIVDAMHRGIPVASIDGIKRRTRATMGWCQGSYCRSRIIEVMERECDHKISDVDTVHSGSNRIQKSEFLAYLKQQELDKKE